MEDSINVNKDTKFRTILIIIGIIMIAIVWIIKYNVESFSILWLIISIVAIILFIGGLIFLMNKYLINASSNKALKQDELPRSITLAQAVEIAKEATKTEEFADYLGGCLDYGVEQLGKGKKSNIFYYKAKGFYENSVYYILINMHYPLEKRAILIDPSEERLVRAKMLLATYPEEEPNVKETITENPLLGTRQIILEKQKQEDKKVETKQEDNKL